MDQKSSKPSQKRRAILQGSLAAPVVLTVPGASAQTNTTLGRCLVNLDRESPPAFFVSDPPPDTWMRVQVQLYRLTAPPQNTVICERAFIDEALLAANQLSPHRAYRDLDAPPSYPQVSFSQSQAQNYTATKNGTVSGLVWVDEQSRRVWDRFQIENPGSYRHATGTCWSSFVRGA